MVFDFRVVHQIGSRRRVPRGTNHGALDFSTSSWSQQQPLENRRVPLTPVIMPRRSLRKSTASASASPASVKRKPQTSTPVRQSKRSKIESSSATKTTPKKSEYFEPDEDDTESHEEEAASTTSAGDDAEASGYEDQDESAESADPSSSELEDVESEEDIKPKKRGRAKKGVDTKALPSRSKTQHLSKAGAGTGLGPGTQVVTKKPKAREAGDTPYTDETIHPNTMLFLKDLMANNNRAWFKSERSQILVCWSFYFLNFQSCQLYEALYINWNYYRVVNDQSTLFMPARPGHGTR